MCPSGLLACMQHSTALSLYNIIGTNVAIVGNFQENSHELLISQFERCLQKQNFWHVYAHLYNIIMILHSKKFFHKILTSYILIRVSFRIFVKGGGGKRDNHRVKGGGARIVLAFFISQE